MDTRFIAVCLMLCQLWATYRPCSTIPNPWIKMSDLELIVDAENAREGGNPAATRPAELRDTTTEVIRSRVEQRGVSDDSSFSHHHANCCQDGYTGRRHGRLMEQESGQMVGRDKGHMVGRLSRHMMGRRNWNTMRQYHRQMGRLDSSKVHNDHMQSIPEDDSKEVDQTGPTDKDYQDMMGGSHYDMMQGYYGMSDEGSDTRGPRRDYRGR